MPIFWDAETVFIRVPKTGSQSIANILQSRTNCLHDVAGRRGGHATMLEHLKFHRDDIATFDSFAVVRNPFANIVSRYHFRKKRQPQEMENVSMDDYVETLCKRQSVHQSFYLCDVQGNIIVDTIFQFENGFEAIHGMLCDRFGLEATIHMPHCHKTEHGTAAEELSAKAVAMITSTFARDFELFGYSLDPKETMPIRPVDMSSFRHASTVELPDMLPFSPTERRES